MAHSAVTKIVLWLVLACCVFFCAHCAFTTLYDGYDLDYDPEAVLFADYVDSNEFRNACQVVQHRMLNRLEGTDEQFRRYAFAPRHNYWIHDEYGHCESDLPEPNEEFFTAKDYWMRVEISTENGGWEVTGTLSEWYLPYYPTGDYAGVCYVAFDDADMRRYQDAWLAARRFYYGQIGSVVIYAAGALLALIWLMAAGRSPSREGVKLYGVDHVWTELTLLALVPGGVGVCLSVSAIVDEIGRNYRSMDARLATFLAALGSCISVLSMVAVLLSLTRKTKEKRFWRDFLVARVCILIWKTIRTCWQFLRRFFDASAWKDGRSTGALARSQLVYLCCAAALVLLTVIFAAARASFGAFLMLAGLLLITVWYILGNQRAFERIDAGLDDSLRQQYKAENAKTALITNVSHDLKTPLTSVITYIDLLAQEEDLSPTARDYVNIIAHKSERLRHLVNDLFELTKSTTGNLQLEMERLDLNRLLEQTVADMKDSIDASGVQFKTELAAQPVFIWSDGKKLYRVFQNLIDNALRYSMPGTRVWLSLQTDGTAATACVKNISAYEMTFSAEEILQRFVRGDASRSGDGSGLGLSIAQSFAQACGGSFKLDIDGDLFKVTITFPVHRGQEKEEV